jgi:hypothetical protein
MGRWEILTNGVEWSSPPLFNLCLARDEIAAHLGPPRALDVDSNGLGLYDAWAVRFPCGLEVTLLAFQTGPYQVPIHSSEPTQVEIHANDTDLAHIRSHLPFPLRGLSKWIPDHTTSPEKRWCVLRQDDNGHRAEMRRCSSRCEAEAIVQEYEARGHKQLYWFEDLPSAGTAYQLVEADKGR